ncbi:unnamed protein product, partial [Discosporangium mesarthrocarpum]
MDVENPKGCTQSTTESEYAALSAVAMEVMFLNVLGFVQPNLPKQCVKIFEDNDGAQKLTKNNISMTRLKHIDIRHHYLEDIQLDKEINIFYVGTADQRVDVLTK